MPDLHWMDATDLAAALRRRELSAVEVMTAHLERIEAVNPSVNAIVSLAPDEALATAAEADAALARGDEPGLLHGLPIAIKDLEDTAGMRTTYGSPIFRDHVPDADSPVVERLRRAGAIVIGKTNTPEFGAGSQTFNPVFGATRNPYDAARTAGGSSGGAAAAVATGMLPLADASDLAGSVRNPSAFCNVVGLRPTPGRIPDHSRPDAWGTLGTLGPIARTVDDAALLLRAMSGPDPRSPIALADDPAVFAGPFDADLAGTRIAWSRDLGGLAVEPEVSAVLEAQRATLTALGCIVEDAEPELTGADEALLTLRALGYVLGMEELLEAHADQLKDTVVWNIRAGLELSASQIAHATAARSRLFHEMRTFLERYDFLVAPVTQVMPFPIEVEWVREIDGVAQETYIDWMRACSRITITSHPAMSAPAGFAPSGLPVGLQIVGRYRDELSLLRLAHAFEAATGFGRQRPPG